MPTLKGFIFDLDGVLVDTARYHFQAWQRLAGELGIPFTATQNEELKGVSRKDSLDKILEWGQKSLPQEEKERLMQQKNEWYLELISELTPEDALPGALDFLQQARQLNLKLALGSASRNARRILEGLQITSSFETIVDGNLVTKSKPNPAVFLAGAKGISLQPEECVVFEDSIAGVEAARQGQFKSVGIGKKNILKKAHWVISGLDKTSPTEVINKVSF